MSDDRDWRLGVFALHLGKPMGAVYACALGIKIPAPYFYGDGTVREPEGMITCALITREHEWSPNAAIATFAEVQDHINKTADYLKLDDQERAEFVAKMNDWILADHIVEGKRFV